MSMSVFRRRDPWWEADGSAARAARRKRRFVATIAFAASVGAIGATVLAWTIELGYAAALGVHAVLPIH